MDDVQPYKDSLRFNVYDLHIIASGIFKNNLYFTAKVVNVYPISRFTQYLLVEVIPLYTIKQIDGIFVKRPLQNYSNVHTVLVPEDVGGKLRDLLRRADSKTSVVISFKKQWMPQKRVKFDNHGIILYFVILTGTDIAASLTTIPLFCVKPKLFYDPVHEFIPKGLQMGHNIRNFVVISELKWHVCFLKPSPRDIKSNIGQNSKSIDYAEESVLGKKLNYNKRQLQKKSEAVPEDCCCFLKNLKSTAPNSNNLSSKSQSNNVKEPDESTKAKEVIIKQEPLKTLESPDEIKIIPFRLIDEKVDTRNDISHLYWIQQ